MFLPVLDKRKSSISNAIGPMAFETEAITLFVNRSHVDQVSWSLVFIELCSNFKKLNPESRDWISDNLSQYFTDSRTTPFSGETRNEDRRPEGPKLWKTQQIRVKCSNRSITLRCIKIYIYILIYHTSLMILCTHDVFYEWLTFVYPNR